MLHIKHALTTLKTPDCCDYNLESDLPLTAVGTCSIWYLKVWEKAKPTGKKTKVTHLKHLEVPWDFSKTRHNKETPYSIQACEQSTGAGRQYRMGPAGSKDVTLVLQNDLNRVLHCKLLLKQMIGETTATFIKNKNSATRRNIYKFFLNIN